MKTRFSLQSLLNEQQRGWSSGNRPTVEQLLAPYSSEQLSDEEQLDLIYGEILLREQMGEEVDPREYLRRFPALAEPISLQLEVHRGLAGLAQHSTIDIQATHPASTDSHRDRAVELPPGYQLLGLLGRGGSGTVYRALDRQLGREVAIKYLTADDAAAKQRLEREAELLAKVHHPGVVQVFGVGQHLGQTWMAQEFVAGGALRKRLTGKPFPPGFAAVLMAKAAQGVAQIQAAGIVHCDLSPGNILLADPTESTPVEHQWLVESTPKVSDFGLARWLHVDRSETGNIEGTLLYMSPEQALGSRSRISPATDVYGLGAILYELLTGRAPFLGPSAAELLEQILRLDPISPRLLRPQLERDLETICLKCLEKDPARRYSTAAELAADLELFNQRRPIAARPIGWTGRTLRWGMRNRALAASLAGLLLVLLAGIATTTTAAWIARANALDARSSKTAVELERNRANNERDLARIERDRADAKAAESARMACVFHDMLNQATPDQQDRPYLLADWIEDSLEQDSLFEDMSPEYEGQLRLRLAEMLQQLDRQQESAPHFRRAIELLDKSGLHDDAGEGRRQLAIILASNTAGWVNYPDRFAEAENLLQQTIQSEYVSPEMRRSATNRLAQCLFLAGKKEQAEQVIRELLDEFETLEPPEEYAEAEARKYYCHLLVRTGRPGQAVPLLRELVERPPGDMPAVSCDETQLQLATALAAAGLEGYPESIDLCEKLLPRALERYGRPTHAAVLAVSSTLAVNLAELGGQPGRLLNDLESLYADIRIDDNTRLATARVVASVHLCQAQVGEAATAWQPALLAIRRLLKLNPVDPYALYVQLLLAKEMSKQGLGEQALPLGMEVHALVSAPEAPEEIRHLRPGSLQTLYGIYLILGNGAEAEAIRAQLPEESVPLLPEHLIHPSLRKLVADPPAVKDSTASGPAK